MPVNWILLEKLSSNLLHKATGVAEANSRRALETAQKFSSQLRAAEDRIAELEATTLP
jgi:hypothetical protein